MNFFPDIQTFLKMGPFEIKWYAVLILLGVGVAYWFSQREVKRMGYKVEVAEDIAMGALIFGLIGARLWYVAFYDLAFYLKNPIHILMTFEGGLAIQGGIFGGILFGLYYAWKHKINFFRMADVIFPYMLIAQAIGRWGNFLNQEAFGRVVTAEFYSKFPTWFSNMMLIQGEYREPTFLYESILNLIGFILIVYVYKRFSKPKRGDMIYAYCLWYGVTRFFVESFRSDSLMFGPIKMAQLTSIIFLIVGVAGMFGLFRKIFKPKKPLLLFDLDGTLLDTEGAIIQTYRYLLNKYHPELEVTREMELSFLGPSLNEMFPLYFSGDIAPIIEEYREYNIKIHPDVVKPIAGAQALLSSLKQQGYHIGIVSTKKRDIVQLGLDLFDMSKDVDVIIGQGEVVIGKPNPEGILKAAEFFNEGHDEMIYVGDTGTDIEAARRAGAYSVGFLFNEERRQKLVDAKPNKIIANLSEIEDLLKENQSWTYNMM